jgi:hypothetical protein
VLIGPLEDRLPMRGHRYGAGGLCFSPCHSAGILLTTIEKASDEGIETRRITCAVAVVAGKMLPA